MKKLIACLFVMALLPIALMIGCDNKAPSTPAAPTATPVVITSTPTKTATRTVTGTPSSTATTTPTMTVSSTATETATTTPTGTPTSTPQPPLAAVPLGSAANFAVLGFSALTNTGATSLCGNEGLWSGTSAGAGYSYCAGSSAFINDGGGIAMAAQADLTIAINDAFGRVNPAIISGDLGGLTFYPGLYKSSGTLDITGNFHLNANGDSTAVFIFQIASTLTTSVGSQVFLDNGALAKNVFWQVDTDVALGDTSIFKGNILAGTLIAFGTGVDLEGRALGKTAITMQADTINIPLP